MKTYLLGRESLLIKTVEQINEQHALAFQNGYYDLAHAYTSAENHTLNTLREVQALIKECDK